MAYANELACTEVVYVHVPCLYMLLMLMSWRAPKSACTEVVYVHVPCLYMLLMLMSWRAPKSACTEVVYVHVPCLYMLLMLMSWRAPKSACTKVSVHRSRICSCTVSIHVTYANELACAQIIRVCTEVVYVHVMLMNSRVHWSPCMYMSC